LPGTLEDKLADLVELRDGKLAPISRDYTKTPQERDPEAREVRIAAIEATPRRRLVLDLYSGDGQFKRLYQRYGFSVISVDKDKTKPVMFKMSAEEFIETHLHRYADEFDLVDFDDSGCPLPAVRLFLSKLAELGRHRPFTLVITDGLGLDLRWADQTGHVDLGKFYLIDRPTQAGDFYRFEQLHQEGVRRAAHRYGYEVEPIILRRYSRGNVVGSAWRVHRVGGSS
jgi:hypothetical protein